MVNFHADLETRITFNQLEQDGTQIECNVHIQSAEVGGKLFYDNNKQLFESELLPTIYLVDNRTNCHDLVNEVTEGGNITVKYIGAIRGPGEVIADMSHILAYSELRGRCLAILRLGGAIVDTLLSSSTSTTTTTTNKPPPSVTDVGKCAYYNCSKLMYKIETFY